VAGENQSVFRDTIQQHSKSFAFASALIPAGARHPVEVLYTWCRRADDAIDLAPPIEREAALERLERELDHIYSGSPSEDTLVLAMQTVVTRYAIPREYPAELLQGMAMDARGTDYDDVETLLLYCYRVAGTVGLMMSHVLGVRDPDALQQAVHLGIAMQLTNICRDVQEDWENRRLYVPQTLLARHGGSSLSRTLDQPLSMQFRPALALSVNELLKLADAYYASADAGMRCLSWRAALSVRAARYIYSEIGSVVRQRECNVFAGRAVVPKARKVTLALKALCECAAEIPYRTLHRFESVALGAPLHFPGDVLLLEKSDRSDTVV
jgi:phytoene synthase